MLNDDYGYVKINLKSYINDNNINPKKLANAAEMDFMQFNRWVNEELSYIDLKVLARLCKAMNCNIESILEYVSNDN